MSPNDAVGMTNSVDPDQTAPLGAVWSESALFAPLGAVWSGSALFAQAYLSKNLGLLRYMAYFFLWFLAYEPAHEIMALFALRELILQKPMHSHPVGLDVWLLVAYVISIIISWAGSSEDFTSTQLPTTTYTI